MTRLTEQSAERHVAERSFDHGPAGFVAAVVEFLPIALLPPADPPAGPVFERLRHGHLFGDAAGVLAVSAPPSPGLDSAVRRLEADLSAARTRLARQNLAPAERAVDTHRPSGDSAGDLPGNAGARTAADREAGRRRAGDELRTATAAVRIRLDTGADDDTLRRRWAVAQAIGPVLTAAFANSPLRHGRPTGWRSTRQALRLAADTPLPPGDPVAAWTAYALDHPLATTGTSVRQALRDGHPLTAEDLDRHLDALPAPVRARGHLELSMVDAQPGEGWRVALAVTAALIDDRRAAGKALVAAADLPPDAWTRAARDGLSDPLLADVARRCFVAAYAALARQGVDRHLRDAVATYIQRYVSRSRTPADDLLDALRTST